MDDSLAYFCNKYCPEQPEKHVGWFDMDDPVVATYVNAIGRAMVISQLVSLDENLGRIFQRLRELELYDDSTIIFTTDNGANVATYGSNGKLRGIKGFATFGGVQTPTVIKSAGMAANSVFEGMFHITDWYSTLASIAGIDSVSRDRETDSIDQHEALKRGESVRPETMLHYDPFSYADVGLSPYISSPYGAIQVGKWNLVGGMPRITEFPPMWYSFVDNNLDEFVAEIVNRDEHWSVDPRNDGTSWWLCNVEEDPYQTRNLLRPEYFDDEIKAIYDELREKIEYYRDHHVADPLGERDPNGYPMCVPRNATDPVSCLWTPGWCDNEGYY